MSVDTEIFIPLLQFILVFIFITIGTIYVLRNQSTLTLSNPPHQDIESDSSDEEEVEESTSNENSPPPENNLSSPLPQTQEIPKSFSLPPFPRTNAAYRPRPFPRLQAIPQFVHKARRYARTAIEHPLPLAAEVTIRQHWYYARTLIQHISTVLECTSCPVYLAQVNLNRRSNLLFHLMAAIILDRNPQAVYQFSMLIRDKQTFDSIRERLNSSDEELFLFLSNLTFKRNTEYLRYTSPTNNLLRQMLNKWNRPSLSTDV